MILCLHLCNEYDNMNTTKQKAAAPTKSKPPPIKKKGRLIIHQSKVKINDEHRKQRLFIKSKKRN